MDGFSIEAECSLCFRYPSQWREIAIDPQVKTIEGTRYDIMFVGTDKVDFEAICTF